MDSMEIVRQVQDIKQSKKITYQEILDAMSQNGVPSLSLSTLRRVFTCDSSIRASKFNYEETLMPILDAVKRIDGIEGDDSQEEVKALRIIISLQDEEIDRKNELIERLIARLDQKDRIIEELLKKCL